MAESGSNGSRRWIWILVVIVVLGGLLYLALPSNRDRVLVNTARVERDNLTKTIATNGKVEPLVDFQAHSPSPSTVAKIDVHLGEQVRAGEPLMQLDNKDALLRVANARNLLDTDAQNRRNMLAGGTHDELLSERADLQNAQSQLNDANASLRSLQALQARGAASANEVGAAQNRVADAQAKVNQIETRMHQRFGPGDLNLNSEQLQRSRIELAAAQNNLLQMDVHSPIAGTVYSLPVARFDYVNPGQPLISVADLHKLQVRAFFDEPEVGNLAAGQPVKIVWDAKPDRAWHGHVVQAPTTIINVGTRNVGECIISVDDANGDLLPNTNVTVTVTTLQRFGVLSLPREALHTQGAQNFVYRVVAGKLVQTPVTLGIVSLTQVEITGGLREGDIVALSAANDADLQNGLAVRTQP